ncbi:Fc.00g105870.m01.CDS01 [Cosmosporella sp. VM-42]
MLAPQVLATLLSVLGVALALVPPQYTGYHGLWSDHFDGAAGTLPVSTKWNVISSTQVFNNEYQKYTNSKNNIQVTGAGRLQLIPRADASAPRGWTSGRIESKYTFTPTAGKITRVESQLRIAGGPAANKQGIWPAFWLMGNAYRQGVLWPASGEIDVMENINGDGIAHGVVHCDKAPGGVCNEPIGLANTISIPDYSWHTWRVDIDRRSTNFKDQSITWYRDGTQFHKVTGTQMNSATVWATLAQKPLYIILNVAVGGDWSGPPNSKTLGGTLNMMEVAYVAHYVST